MEITNTWTAIRTDRALSAAHGGASLAYSSAKGALNTAATRVPVSPMGFVVVETPVKDQGSNPPREESG